jgi:hypothetical protein
MLLLTACSTTSKTAAFTPSAAKPGEAIVYIYRPSEMTNALYSPGLTVDDEFKLYIKNGLNSRLSLPPGEHIFRFQAEKKYADLVPVTLTMDAGEIYYIRVSTSLEVKNSVGYEPYARSFKLKQVDNQIAVKEIAECCLDNNTGPQEKTKSTSKEADDGFSVDKTQNPFSH